jgi:uncharacterized protein YprB with RNaseH-like and TPR domain
VDLAARLDALRASLNGRQQLAAALKSALPPGVQTATEFFRDHPPREQQSVGQALPDMQRDRRCGGHVLVRTESVALDACECAVAESYRLPMACLDALEQRATIPRVFSGVESGSIAPERIAFIDTETTGLSGGTGTIAFLVGIGWLERDESTGRLSRFTLEQLLVEDFAHEPAMLDRLAGHLDRFDAVCTYNGRGFDVPLLRSRFAMNRMNRAAWRKPNLDLLPFARRLWRGDLGNARLKTIESGVLGVDRVGDIEGSQIPDVWHQWARTGQPGLIPVVMTHNAQDIASLVAILARQMAMAAAPLNRSVVTRSSECLGLARWCETRGDWEIAAELYERALGMMPDPGADVRLLLRLARLHRRVGKVQAAVDIWRELQRRPLVVGFAAWLEHARHLEHHCKDLASARMLVHRCLSQAEMENELHCYSGRSGAAPVSLAELESLRRRLARLDRRVEKARKAAASPPKRPRKPRPN